MTAPTLRGERVVLRPLKHSDLKPLGEILAEPSVSRWWGLKGVTGPDATWLEDDEEVRLAIELDGLVIGCIQYAEEDDPAFRHAGIDIFLAAAQQGRGLGPDAILAVARHLFEDHGHHRLTIDPAADNESAIRAYRRVGFRPVGVMRAYERGADGTFHDGLLMELLRSEFV